MFGNSAKLFNSIAAKIVWGLMLGRTYFLLAIGVALLFGSVVYTITMSTGRLVDTQAELLRQRISGELGDASYAQRSAEAEKSYRQEVAEALEKLVEKLRAAAGLLNRTAPESNLTANLSALSSNLTAAIESLRGG